MARKKTPTSSADAPSYPRIFVRRGALRRFDRLKKAAADLPVTVQWDRRTEERRSTPKSVTEESRKGDRRQQPPFTWKVADFVLVEAAEEAAAARKTARKRASTTRR